MAHVNRVLGVCLRNCLNNVRGTRGEIAKTLPSVKDMIILEIMAATLIGGSF